MLTGMEENDPFAVSRRAKGTLSRRAFDRVLMLAVSRISFEFSDDRRIPFASGGTVAAAMLGFVLACLSTSSGVGERRCRKFGAKHLYAQAHFNRSPAVPGLNGVCDPLAVPLRRARLASGRLRRRLSGGRMLVAAVLHLLCADKSAGSVGHVKCRSRRPPRRNGRPSRCSVPLRRSSFRLLLSSGANGGSGGRGGMPPRGRRAGTGRFGVRPRPGGRVQSGAQCRRVRESFLCENRVTENWTSTLPASVAHHP